MLCSFSLLLGVLLALALDSFASPTVVSDTGTIIALPTLWNVSSADNAYQNLPANVPGDLLSDLMNAGVIQDPYYDRNFLTQRRVWMGPLAMDSNNNGERRTRTWIYSTVFELDEDIIHSQQLVLVAESIKMGAVVELNGVTLGVAKDQFTRYMFDLPHEVLDRSTTWSSKTSRRHEIRVIFDPELPTDGRFMACSGGWDWAPYVRT